MEDNKFTIVDDKGMEIPCTLIAKFKVEQTNKDYIIYKKVDSTDGEVFAAIYDPNDKNMNLIQIENDDEWQLIENALKDISNN